MSLAIGLGCPGRGGHQSTALAEKKRFGYVTEGFEGLLGSSDFAPGRQGPPEPLGDVCIGVMRSVAFAAYPKEKHQGQKTSTIHKTPREFPLPQLS